MRWISKVAALAAVLTVSAVAVTAQAKECNDEFKTATYSKWYDSRKDNQDVAYQTAKEYVTVCPTDESPYATALKKFIADYDKVHSNQKLATDFEAAVKAKNYAEQIRLGKQLTTTTPDNAVIYVIMAGAGLGDANLLPESALAAKKAIELIEAGKPFAPAYQTKDQALAAMNYVLAKAAVKTSPIDAIASFIKAAKYESDLKKSALVYNELAAAYGQGPVAKYAKEYGDLAAAGKSVDSPEIKLVVANLNQALDGQIDAFARAAALSKNPTDKKAIMDVLTDVYKGRHKLETGLNERVNELVAGVLNKPLPDMPTPITSLPTPTPTGSSGSTVGAMPSATAPTSAAPTNSPKPSSTASGTPSSTATKPAASPTPKPRQRRNHRGH